MKVYSEQTSSDVLGCPEIVKGCGRTRDKLDGKAVPIAGRASWPPETAARHILPGANRDSYTLVLAAIPRSSPFDIEVATPVWLRKV